MTSLKQQRNIIFERSFCTAENFIIVRVWQKMFECDDEDTDELADMNGRYVYDIELENKTAGEMEIALNFTFDREKAENFAAVCEHGLVTPVTFQDIVEDYLA